MLIFKRLTIALLAIALTACGFHLRGSQSGSTATLLSYQTLSIVGDNQSSIGINLADLMRGQVHIVTAPAPAQVTAEIGEITHSRTTATKNAQGRVTEYRVYASVSVQAYDANKNQLLAPTRLTISRLLSAGDGYVTGLEFEESRLIDVMDLELANQIQYRLRAIKLAR